jgi:spore coat polysaccharide biosynthesis protein SpsF
VNIPPLAIIQARLGSSRVPGKMLLPLCGKPLIQHVYDLTARAFFPQHVVVACPADEANKPLRVAVENFGGEVFAWEGPENDVLGRFHACAHRYRWHPDSVIVRVTPDDPFKDPGMMKRVAAGERLPVEQGAEAFTLGMLDAAQAREPYADNTPIRDCFATRAEFTCHREYGLCRCGRPTTTAGMGDEYRSVHADNLNRQHITHALFAHLAPAAPDKGHPWSIDTREEYERVRAIVEGH